MSNQQPVFSPGWTENKVFGQVREVKLTDGTTTCRIRPVRFGGPGYYYVVLDRGIAVVMGRDKTVELAKEACETYIDAVKHGLKQKD